MINAEKELLVSPELVPEVREEFPNLSDVYVRIMAIDRALENMRGGASIDMKVYATERKYRRELVRQIDKEKKDNGPGIA